MLVEDVSLKTTQASTAPRPPAAAPTGPAPRPPVTKPGPQPKMKQYSFSSRRRHTMFACDWSSDVCSSDLHLVVVAFNARDVHVPHNFQALLGIRVVADN